MQKIIVLIMGTAFSLTLAAARREFQHIIRCTSDTSSEKIVVGLNLFENEALLNYQSSKPNSLISLGIGKPFGFYSSAHVAMKSTFSDRLDKEQIITITAHDSHITRVSQISEFSLVLEKHENGTFSPKKLSYKRANDAFPEDNTENTLENLPLTCTLEN